MPHNTLLAPTYTFSNAYALSCTRLQSTSRQHSFVKDPLLASKMASKEETDPTSGNPRQIRSPALRPAHRHLQQHQRQPGGDRRERRRRLRAAEGAAYVSIHHGPLCPPTPFECAASRPAAIRRRRQISPDVGYHPTPPIVRAAHLFCHLFTRRRIQTHAGLKNSETALQDAHRRRDTTLQVRRR
jgi:hypothetical protein